MIFYRECREKAAVAAALQMLFAFTTPPVKMRLERSAERDKREIINILSAEYAQSARDAHSKSSRLPLQVKIASYGKKDYTIKKPAVHRPQGRMRGMKP